MSVRPSGLLPSDLDRPWGSLTEGMLALVMERQMMSLRKWCRCALPRQRFQWDMQKEASSGLSQYPVSQTRCCWLAFNVYLTNVFISSIHSNTNILNSCMALGTRQKYT